MSIGKWYPKDCTINPNGEYGNELVITSLHDNTIQGNFTTTSTTGRIASISFSGQLDSNKADFTFNNDGWGNKGTGSIIIIIMSDSIHLKIKITSQNSNANWSIYEENNNYYRLSNVNISYDDNDFYEYDDMYDDTYLDEYIFSDSSYNYLSKEDLYPLSQSETRLALNEIYARNGYVFKDEYYHSYFESKSWYSQNPEYDISLTEVEQANINLITSYEKEMGWR